MKLVDKESGAILNGIIEKVEPNKFKKLKNNKDFVFDWKTEINNEVYKISLKLSKEVLGLMSLIDFSEECRIHINLIESTKKQRGKVKTILNIPGCLIGFACKLAFKRGYGGFVSLTPKTKLIDYYHKNYGFVHFGINMAVYEEKADFIIQKYFGNE